MTTLTIGELAKRVGMRTSALRYYQERGLLEPVGRTQSGYRLYAPEAEQILRFIQRAQRLGFSLSDIHTLLEGWRDGDLSNEAVIKTAEERYLVLERQVTQWMVLQHELGLFLQDMRQRALQQENTSAASLLDRLHHQVCADPLIQPATTTLEVLMDQVGCSLSTTEGQRLLDDLRGEHVHIWQEGEDFYILVVSDNPIVGSAVEALAQFEANCQAHGHTSQSPESMHSGEGFLLVARGENAFLFARLFLALQSEVNR